MKEDKLQKAIELNRQRDVIKEFLEKAKPMSALSMFFRQSFFLATPTHSLANYEEFYVNEPLKTVFINEIEKVLADIEEQISQL
jgi:hypothetical protein